MSSKDATPPDVEHFYDRYLDACHGGEAEDPDAFFARHPGIDTEERGQIRALHRVLREAAGDELPFDRLGDYRLLKRLGGGGMGTVYVAEQVALRRIVALKVIRPELQASDTAMRRFEREALAIARLRHPNVVTVHELGAAGDVRYLAMELVPGRPLRDVIAGERPAVPRILSWIRQVARALHAAHEQGVVHRDVKPSNILITPEDRAVLLDFGMAHLTEVGATTLTRSFAGSPSYAAPEQLGLGEVDARTDVYALGVSLYECLTGRLPFEGGTMEGLFRQILTEDPPSPRSLNPAVEPSVEIVTLKAMEKRPQDRYRTAAAFGADLDALLHAQPIRARPPTPLTLARRHARRHPARAAAIATLVVAALAFLGYLVHAGWEEARQRRADARAKVAEAGRILDGCRASRDGILAIEKDYAWLENAAAASYRTDEQDREFEVVADRRDGLLRAREESFLHVLDLLRLAERLDPDVPGGDAVRARLYLARMEDALAVRDFARASVYRELVDEHDPDGAVAKNLSARGRLTLVTEPPGAEVFLFRYRELAKLRGGGERRLVPVPDGIDPASLPLGSWALRVVVGAGGVEPGDLLLAVEGYEIRNSVLTADGDRVLSADGNPVRNLADVEALADGEHDFVFARAGAMRRRAPGWLSPAELAARGGTRARVYHLGAVREVELPPGLVVRTTAAPRFLHAEASLGRTPLEYRTDPGPAQVVFRLDGYEDLLWSFELRPGEGLGETRRLNPRGATPDGFVYVPHGEYWIQEREVTCGEYLEFLNALPVGERETHTPRHGPERWPVDADGTYAVPADWRADWPALGVSYEDALAYASWRSRRDRRSYVLPSRAEWVRAADGDMQRRYTWGNVFRPKWLKSCFARSNAGPEPVLRYPIDESPYGAYDLCGSSAEWLDDWFDRERGYRRLGGSSWGMADPEQFDIWGGMHAAPDVASHNFGIRLLFRRVR